MLSGWKLGRDLNSAFPVAPTTSRASEKRASEGLHSASARNGLWHLLAEAELLSAAGVEVWQFGEPPGEPGGAVKCQHVTHSADAWQAVAHGNLWTLLPSCAL